LYKYCLLLSKVTVASRSYSSNVSTLQPYDALLKCVVTEFVLFSIVALRHWHFTR